MSTTSTAARNGHTTETDTSDSAVELTAQQLWEAELALHDARQTQSEEWIRAAADHLHTAIARHLNAIEHRPSP